jgi:TPP-dependent pyruvate/acetoin dehydrogenase alpha subunit
MADKAGSKGTAPTTVPHESPLVPNRKISEMYDGILQARLFEDHLHTLLKKSERPHTRGQEACRIAALIDLSSEDLISDAPNAAPITALLRGIDPETILKTLGAKKTNPTKLDLPSLLPAADAEDTADRLHLALGAALALKRLSLPHVLVFFANAGDLRLAAWEKYLRLAAAEELPILFVALPKATRKDPGRTDYYEPFALSARATAAGVPGIPIDASDGIALYRVVQESLGRARAGGGPAFMECTTLLIEDSKAKGADKVSADPLTAMAQTLIARRLATPESLAQASSIFAVKLATL